MQHFVDSASQIDLPVLPSLFSIGVSPKRISNGMATVLSGKLLSTQSHSDTDEAKEEKFLICEIRVVGVDGRLKNIAEEALTIRPNFSYTLSEVQCDMKEVLRTGYFKSEEV